MHQAISFLLLCTAVAQVLSGGHARAPRPMPTADREQQCSKDHNGTTGRMCVPKYVNVDMTAQKREGFIDVIFTPAPFALMVTVEPSPGCAPYQISLTPKMMLFQQHLKQGQVEKKSFYYRVRGRPEPPFPVCTFSYRLGGPSVVDYTAPNASVLQIMEFNEDNVISGVGNMPSENNHITVQISLTADISSATTMLVSGLLHSLTPSEQFFPVYGSWQPCISTASWSQTGTLKLEVGAKAVCPKEGNITFTLLNPAERRPRLEPLLELPQLVSRVKVVKNEGSVLEGDGYGLLQSPGAVGFNQQLHDIEQQTWKQKLAQFDRIFAFVSEFPGVDLNNGVVSSHYVQKDPYGKLMQLLDKVREARTEVTKLYPPRFLPTCACNISGSKYTGQDTGFAPITKITPSAVSGAQKMTMTGKHEL